MWTCMYVLFYSILFWRNLRIPPLHPPNYEMDCKRPWFESLNIIHYFSSRQVIWSHIRCLDVIFPEPEAMGIFNPDNVYETILPFWSWNNIFVILQILYKTPIYYGVARVFSSFFISCRIWRLIAPLKRSHQRMVYSKWIIQRNTPIEQTLNSNDVEARETFPTFENCTGKNCYDVKNNGFSGRHGEVSLTSRAPYIRLQP